MMPVYLAGPIFGCTDDEVHGWRAKAAELLACPVLDPMRRDYRGAEDANVARLVEADLADIRASSVVLVNAARPSWGTAMEIVYARNYGVPVVAFVAGRASPWLVYHATVLADLASACACIRNGEART